MRLLSLVLALCLAVLPGAAQADPVHRYEALAQWAGCTALVVTSDQHSAIESYYDPREHTLYLGTGSSVDGPQVPATLELMIALHEIGHCLQYLEGQPMVDDVTVELDADRRSADLACALGLDGTRLLHDLFVWAHDALGYDGDPSHGTLAQRISQAGNARACRLPKVQGA